MPFKSKSQRRFFYSRLPYLAKTWEDHTPKGTDLTEKTERKQAGMLWNATKNLGSGFGTAGVYWGVPHVADSLVANPLRDSLGSNQISAKDLIGGSDNPQLGGILKGDPNKANSQLSDALHKTPSLISSLNQNLIRSKVSPWRYHLDNFVNNTSFNDGAATAGSFGVGAFRMATNALLPKTFGLQTAPQGFGMLKSIRAGAGMTVTDWINNHIVSKAMGPAEYQAGDGELPANLSVSRQIRNIASGAIGGRAGGPWGAVAGAVYGNFKQPLEMLPHLWDYQDATANLHNQNILNLANLSAAHPGVANAPHIQKMIQGFSPDESGLFNDAHYTSVVRDFLTKRSGGEGVNVADLRNRLNSLPRPSAQLLASPATTDGKTTVSQGVHQIFDHFDNVQALKGVGLATAAAMGVAGISAWLKHRRDEKEKEQQQQPMLMAPKLAKWVFA